MQSQGRSYYPGEPVGVTPAPMPRSSNNEGLTSDIDQGGMGTDNTWQNIGPSVTSKL